MKSFGLGTRRLTDEQDSSFRTDTHHAIGSSFCQGGRKAMCLPPSPEEFSDQNTDEPYHHNDSRHHPFESMTSLAP